MKYYARPHPQHRPPDGAEPPLLCRHLVETARLTRSFASGLRPGDEAFAQLAFLIGLTHDIGKYSDRFQYNRIWNDNSTVHVDHSIYAALLLRPLSEVAALIVAGHHTGMTSVNGHSNGIMSLEERAAGKKDEALQLLKKAIDDFRRNEIEAPLLDDLLIICRAYYNEDKDMAYDMVMKDLAAPEWMLSSCPSDRIRTDEAARMLFSCLVDADKFDAARLSGLVAPDGTLPRNRIDDPRVLVEWVEGHVDRKRNAAAEARTSEKVMSARDAVLQDCIRAVNVNDKMFSLSAPTGCAKTMSSLTFAIKKMARDKSIRRVIVVVPYLSILEQTIEDYKSALGSDVILERHSGNIVCQAKPDCDDEFIEDAIVAARENWSPLIVVTTMVQFVEGFFSNKPRDQRRTHNLANSIVIMDESQLVPRECLVPVLSMMKGLAENWNTTFLFTTATPPAFESASESNRLPRGTLKEICSETSKKMFDALRLVDVKWPRDVLGDYCSWQEVAAEVARHEQSMVIVNLKRHARWLFALLRKKGRRVLILTSRMCPRHRRQVLREVTSALNAGEEICLVATQLVECGVDIDFPFVFRAMGPLDRMKQASGRCNRKGRLSKGVLVIFRPAKILGGSMTPPGAYFEATDITSDLFLNEGPLDIYDPEVMTRYFDLLYSRQNNEQKNDRNYIETRREFRDFPEVARLSIIEDESTQVVIPLGKEGLNLVESLKDSPRETSREPGWKGNLLRKAKPFLVGLRDKEVEMLLNEGRGYEIELGKSHVVIARDCAYDEHMGLICCDAELERSLKTP